MPSLNTVHVFACVGRFRSFEDIGAYVDAGYNSDGDRVDSQFIREVGLQSYEPACIEAIHEERAIPLRHLLAGTSYADQWLALVSASVIADSAICVFSPNRLVTPERCSVQYVGAYEYRV